MKLDKETNAHIGRVQNLKDDNTEDATLNIAETTFINDSLKNFTWGDNNNNQTNKNNKTKIGDNNKTNETNKTEMGANNKANETDITEISHIFIYRLYASMKTLEYQPEKLFVSVETNYLKDGVTIARDEGIEILL